MVMNRVVWYLKLSKTGKKRPKKCDIGKNDACGQNGYFSVIMKPVIWHIFADPVTDKDIPTLEAKL